MENNENIVNDSAENVEMKSEPASQEKAETGGGFKFFKCCSASLKRFSILIFAINIFLVVSTVIIGGALIALKLGLNMATVLVLPMICVVIILVVFARFISALIYGFAEIVEKNEKK